MRNGIIPENIYLRSVKKTLDKYNKDINKGTAAAEDCAFLCINEFFLGNDSAFWGMELELGMRTLDIKEAAVAGKPAAVQANITLPCEFDEKSLKELVKHITECACARKLAVKDVEVMTSPQASAVHVSVFYIGSYIKKACMSGVTSKNVPEIYPDIIVTGRIGASAGAYIAAKNVSKLEGRFGSSFLKGVLSMPGRMDPSVISEVLKDEDVIVFPVGEGGIFAALWDLGEYVGCGLTCDIRKIPILQETVEICNELDINPYTLHTCDCVVICGSHGEELADKLEAAGIEAAVTGKFTKTLARAVVNNDEIRYLTRPEQDEMFRLGLW